MESSQIEYFTQQNCNLTKVGGQLDTKGYGIALPVSKLFPFTYFVTNNPLHRIQLDFFIDSPYRTHVSQAVLKLQEEGKLAELKNRWWVDKNPGAGECDDGGGAQSDTPELGLDNVGGVFLVLGGGVLLGIFVGIIDFIWNIRQIAIDESVGSSFPFLKNSRNFVFYLIFRLI